MGMCDCLFQCIKCTPDNKTIVEDSLEVTESLK